MKLIGIYIDKQTTATVCKNLKPGWYPFLDGYKYQEGKIIHSPKNDSLIDKLYKTKESGPDIFVHAIAGKNGSGKSTILEILFRLINNLATKIIPESKRLDSAPLILAEGLYACFFFKTDGDIKCLHAENTDIYIQEKNKERIHITSLLQIDFLRSFFYTISVNYSHYALNVREYEDVELIITKNKGKLPDTIYYKHWLNGLAHKNDGYLTPIVLSPMRTEGQIDINNEEKLSKERLIGLFLLSKKDGFDFLKGYKAHSLKIKFKPKSPLDKRDKVGQYWAKHKSRGYTVYLELFQSAYNNWKKILERDQLLNDNLNSIQESILNYLAYKTISISSKYPSFASIVKLVPEKVITSNVEKKIPRLIDKIYTDESHITLKIRQCMSALRNIDNIFYKELEEKTEISPLVSNFNKELLPANRKYTVDEIFEILPPPMFELDIHLERSKEDSDNDSNSANKPALIHLSKMSSGERQLLYSLSAVMYHLKNIQSIQDRIEAYPNETEKDYNRIKYKHVNIILDEVEMYYHPEYQRQYISKLLNLIDGLHLNKKDIQSINICIVTHSPFILSDVLRENTLFLEEGVVANNKVKEETFGANFYDILRNGFFLEDNALGCFVNGKIQQALSLIEKYDRNNEALDIKEILESRNLINLIGDPFIKGYLLNKIDDICIK